MPKRVTTEQFIEKAKLVHGDLYDYSKVVYVKTKLKVKIICKTHGEFEQMATSHLKGSGCIKCKSLKATLTKEQFVEKSKLVHGNLYNYSKVVYVGGHLKVKIICKEHGEFEQRANAHLQGYGCRNCGDLKRALTTEQFFEKAKLVHGNLYNYSKVVYVTNRLKVKIICREHGEFEQQPSNHLMGAGCVKCQHLKATLTKEQFVEKSKLVHGDVYDYSKVVYVNSKLKVKIICKEHGEFEKRPHTHLMGAGCVKCQHLKATLTKEQFVEKSKLVHGDVYDYSKVVYVNSKLKVKIICKEHGEFEQKVTCHLQGRGCLKCGILKATLTNEQFIEKAKLVHGDLYDYSKAIYVKTKVKVKVICKDHGEFEQTPNTHLSGMGCAKCEYSKRALTTEQFIEKAKLVHGDLYDYSKTIYVSAIVKVKIICKLHGEFEQQPSNHLQGRGCLKCRQEMGWWSRSGYVEMAKNYGGKSNLYVIRCEKYGEVFYKIGITVGKIKNRFSLSKLPYHFDVIYRVEGDAEKIWNMEKMIHRQLKHLQYQPKIPFLGQTECFSELPESFHNYIGVRAVPRKQIHN